MAASLQCSPDVGHSDKQPVLLVPRTAVTFKIQWEWNFALALSHQGIPWCGVSPPGNQLGDTQLAGEYDTYAIRTLYRRSGNRKIAIVGHSLGGMQPRWPLRFWPDTRAMVADMIGTAPDNQGAGAERTFIDVCPPTGQCRLNFWQGATGSNFIKALNSCSEMFSGIDYTVLYSTNDGLVQPQDTPLHGPGSPERIDRSVCSQTFMPAVTPQAGAIGATQFTAAVASGIANAPRSDAEPPLECYVTATCTGARAPTLQICTSTTPRPVRVGSRVVVRVSVHTDQGGSPAPAPVVTVSLAGHRRTTDATGRARFRIRLKYARAYQLTATRTGTNPASTRIKVRRAPRGAQ